MSVISKPTTNKSSSTSTNFVRKAMNITSKDVVLPRIITQGIVKKTHTLTKG